MTLSRAALDRITRLRELFLDDDRGAAPLADYWRSADDLQAYDEVLGARIGWKWDAALAEAKSRGFGRADGETVLDFGCGSGIASRRFLAHCGAGEVLYHDRSRAAMAFAAERLRAVAPSTKGRALRELAAVQPDVLLVSHVVGELDAQGLDELRGLIHRSRRVVIVEPGNRSASRRLSTLRDELLAQFTVLAPCTHALACPALPDPNEWCHFFAPPPPEVFTESHWVLTARALGIDLRALPYSFLALVREPAAQPSPRARVLGRPIMAPHHARVRVCDAAGLRFEQVEKRTAKATWKALKKAPETVRFLPHEGAEPCREPDGDGNTG